VTHENIGDAVPLTDKERASLALDRAAAHVRAAVRELARAQTLRPGEGLRDLKIDAMNLIYDIEELNR
jgi:hypothetical protein